MAPFGKLLGGPALLAALFTLAACSSDSPTEVSFESLQTVSGQSQTGTAGSALQSQLVVVALDEAGAPLPGVTITWSVTEGGGTVAPTTVTSGARGLARATWTLGTVAGANSARASATETSYVEFSATGTAGQVVAVELDSSEITVDLGRTAQLEAEAWDQYGNRVTGATFIWATADSGVATVSQDGAITPVAKGLTTVTASAASGPSDSASVTVPDPPLRYLASLRGIDIGSAVNDLPLDADSTYRLTLDREFNSITPESVMKFWVLRPTRGTFDFARADRLMEFAEASAMVVHGHTLVWHVALPGWLVNGDFNKSELLSILKDHILTVVGRYEGRVAAWDVVNEAVADDGISLRNGIWLETIGPEYIDSAFTWAAQADPAARLYYNDYSGEGLGAKSDGIFDLVSDLVAKGVPIHGVGLESHFELNGAPPEQDVIDNMTRIAGLGLEVRISELDVRIRETPTQSDFDDQAVTYRSLLGACLSAVNCTAIAMWGFSDAYSWIPAFFPGWGWATILDETFDPKPAYWALFDELSNPD